MTPFQILGAIVATIGGVVLLVAVGVVVWAIRSARRNGTPIP